MNFTKYLRTPFLKKHRWWLILNISDYLTQSNEKKIFLSEDSCKSAGCDSDLIVEALINSLDGKLPFYYNVNYTIHERR